MSMPTPSITSPILSQAKDTAGLTGNFLSARELESFSRSCKHFQALFNKTVIEKKKVSELLTHVFNADPKSAVEFLEQNAHSVSISSEPTKSSDKTCLVLTKSSCKEEYFSPSKKKMMVKRTWNNISPLEAATWCGDSFLVLELLKYVPEAEFEKAAEQIEAVLNRKPSEENGVFLSSFVVLGNAYKEYCKNQLDLTKAEKWEKIDELMNQIWQGQRLLPTYGLQEYFDDKRFYCVTKRHFLKEPKRGPLLCGTDLYNLNPLDLETMPFGCAWYKGKIAGRPTLMGKKENVYFADAEHCQSDYDAIKVLYHLRKALFQHMASGLKESGKLARKFSFGKD